MSKIQISKVTPFGLRLLPKLKEALDALAEANGRSLNAEITERLEWSLTAETEFAAFEQQKDERSKLAFKRLMNIGTADAAEIDELQRRVEALEAFAAQASEILGIIQAKDFDTEQPEKSEPK